MPFERSSLRSNSSISVQGTHARLALEGAKGPGLPHGTQTHCWPLNNFEKPKEGFNYLSTTRAVYKPDKIRPNRALQNSRTRDEAEEPFLHKYVMALQMLLKICTNWKWS